MEWLPWFLVAIVVLCVAWFSYEVIRLLRTIAEELRHIRKYLQEVSGEFGKISGPLDYVEKIYGLGEKVLRRNPEK